MMRGAGSGRVAEYDEARNRLRAALAERLRLDPDVIDPAEPFARYGLDSVGAAALVAELSDWLGRPISPVVVWEYPTVDALAAHLSGRAAPTVGRAAGAASTADEPIAVVGLACRFPGAPDPAAYWRLLCEGRGAIGEVPPGRWDEDLVAAVGLDGPDAAPFRRGGFLPSVDGFDAAFFRISPREAAQLDPQQRLMLELAWEALEDAGIAADALRGTPTGVFCGVIWHDYAEHHRLAGAEITLHTGVGQALGVVANRISYALGLNGPSVALDTACSSSLLALHLACQSLRSGESALALAGGVNLMLAPTTTAVLREFGGLSAEGECRPFDARANGFVRGEGAGFVVLKPLSRALADGDRIYCTIRGSAANNDGASNGLTAPNPAAQEAVLREAVHRAGISPAAVDYVEAHGTGTVLGDPIEARALGAVFGPGRAPERPLRIGSVKGSIGHLEGAAGIAGVIKVCLMLKHRAIPPSLGFREPNPHIAFDDLGLKVQTTLEPWPDEGRPAVAGVSAFGWGGTNCHVVLEEHPSRRAELVTLAADSPAALRRMAEALRERAADGQRDLAALRADAAVLSTLGSHRLAVVADSAGDLVRRLDAYLDGASMPGVRVGSAERAHGPLVFVYSPQGSQWLGMGRGLIAAEPVFKAVLERCDRVVRDEAGWSLLEELSADPAHSRLDEVDVVQPLISCVQMALTELWRSWGVVPDVVVGHSLGEVAAAYAAGILDLEDAVRLICVYSRMQTRPECRGGKAIINLPADDAARLVEPYGGRVVVAGLNGPASTLLSGDADALDEVVAACAARSVFAARVQVNVAVHNPRFESVVADMTAALSWLRPRSARIPMVSTVDARAIAGPECRGEYWARNLRQPVLFWPVIRELLATGHRAFVEVSPHGILTHALKQAFEHEGVAGLCVPTLRRGDDERASMLDTLGALYVEGRTITINGTRADGGEDSEVAHILPLSARSAGALEDLAREFVRRLEAPGEGTARDICYTAAARRAHLDHRLAVVAATRRELSARLDGVLRGEEPAGVARGRVRLAGRPRIVFAFAGQGPQWWGIGRDLLEREPVFRSVVYQCRDLLAAHADWDLLEELMRDEASSRLNESEVAQPALFAFQVALAALWRSWGIEPEAVVGHSMGEVAAAHVAGALSLEDAVRVIYRRGRVMQEAAGRGAMVAVQLPAERADDPLTDYRDSVSIAALNGPGWVVLSGDAAAIAELTRNLEASGVTCRPLSVDYASHSPQMEPCRHALTASVQGIEALAPTIPIYSTVTGGLATGAGFFDAEYWGRNIRQPVLFAPTIGALVREGYSHFIEIGAHPILATMILECAVAAGTEVSALASLRRGQPGRVTMLTSLGALYVDGCEVNWAGVNPKGGRFVRLPNYPWQRKRYWFKRQSERARRRRVTGAVAAHSAGLPGRRLHVAVPTFESQVDPDLRAFALDHRVDGGAFVPASLFVELGLAAAERALGPGAYGIEDLSIDEPLVCREGDARTVQVTLPGVENGAYTFQVHSAVESEDEAGATWTLHAAGAVRAVQLDDAAAEETRDVSSVRARCPDEMDAAAFYESLERAGIRLAGAYRVVDRCWRGDGEVLVRMRVPADTGHGRCLGQYGLDGCFQACLALPGAAGAPDDAAPRVYVVAGLERYDPLLGSAEAGGAVWAHARLRPAQRSAGDAIVIDVRAFDEALRPVAEIEGLLLRPVDRAELRALAQGAAPAAAAVGAESSPAEWLYEVAWQPVDTEGADHTDTGGVLANARWLVITDRAGFGELVAEAVRARGIECTLVDGDAAALVGTLDQWVRSGGPGIVVDLRALDVPDHAAEAEGVEEAARSCCIDALDLVRGLAGRGADAALRLWLVTRGAQPVVSDDSPFVAQAPVWGLGRVMALEFPEIWGGLIDLDPRGVAASEAIRLVEQIQRGAGEDQTAFRGSIRYVARLVRAALPPAASLTVRKDGAYLITGGFGQLGLRLARWLAEQGAGHLVLVGRRGLPDSADAAALANDSPERARIEAVREIERLGTVVTAVAADVADAGSVAALIRRFGADLPPLRGIIHAAAVIDPRPTRELTVEQVEATLRPKIAGARNLHHATLGLDLDFFILFSTAAAVWGSRGLAHYAAANHFLDALAHHRAARGLPALAVGWGLWAEGGTTDEMNRFFLANGILPMPSAPLFELLGSLAASCTVQRTIAHVDWEAFRAAYEQRGRRALLAALDEGKQVEPEGRTGQAATELMRRLRAAPPARAREMLVQHVTHTTAEVLGFEPTEYIDPQQGFFQLGMDSLMTVQMRTRLERTLGFKLPITVAFEYPTIEALSGYLTELVVGSSDGADAGAPASAPGPAVPSGPADIDSLHGYSEEEVAALLDAAVAELLNEDSTDSA